MNAPPGVSRLVGVASASRGEHFHLRQQTEPHRYGHVVLLVEPSLRDGIEIVWSVEEDQVPAGFSGDIIHGIRDSFSPGKYVKPMFSGVTFTRTLVRIVGGSYHDVDSDNLSYRLAACSAFVQAVEKAGLKELETGAASTPKEPRESPLLRVVGQDLSAVTFVRDYVQLQFDGPLINVMSPITVLCDGVEARSGDVRFRDLICAQVSKEVVAANIEEGVYVRLDFVDGSMISLSLRPADYKGPEAVLIQGLHAEMMVI